MSIIWFMFRLHISIERDIQISVAQNTIQNKNAFIRNVRKKKGSGKSRLVVAQVCTQEELTVNGQDR